MPPYAPIVTSYCRPTATQPARGVVAEQHPARPVDLRLETRFANWEVRKFELLGELLDVDGVAGPPAHLHQRVAQHRPEALVGLLPVQRPGHVHPRWLNSARDASRPRSRTVCIRPLEGAAALRVHHPAVQLLVRHTVG